MEIKFLGAAQEVTGSSYLVTCGGRKFFVDCGIHQGRDEDEKNKEALPVNPAELEAVILTHAHMDHSGRIPFLVKNGFKGRILATRPTLDLLNVVWRDSAHLMMEEAAWRSKKNSRKGLPPEEPLYDTNDVEDALKLLSPVEYEIENEILPGVKVLCHNAGHILGSSSISLTLREDGKEVALVFSGDLGQLEPIMDRAPYAVKKAHYVLIESTYGDRRHKSLADTRSEFRSVIVQALKDKGKVFIPSFVIGRAQRILYELLLMQEEGLIPELPVFFDSPMGVKATELYRRYHETLSDDVQRIAGEGRDPFAPLGLTYVSSPEESRAINNVDHGIVIAGSGMCTGGRIVHHLKHGLWNPKNHVIFVGYQGYGTLGRRIVDGASELRIAGEDVTIAAQVHTIGGFSAHGDRDDLITWAQNFETNPLFFVVHGERAASHSLASDLQQEGMRSLVPVRWQEFQLFAESVLKTETLEAARPEEDNKGAAVLNVLSRIIEELRRDLKGDMELEEIMPLLMSSRTLLELAGDKVKNARPE